MSIVMIQRNMSMGMPRIYITDISMIHNTINSTSGINKYAFMGGFFGYSGAGVRWNH
jgi:hypothetical protein